jgi:hypothetical protein
VRGYREEDLWQELYEMNSANQASNERMLRAAIGGPIRFEPIGHPAPNALLPYLADVRRLETMFAWQVMLALHENRRNDAWTNLLAATCLVTEYAPEPIDISHMARFACATLAYDATWNALQAGNWTDAQLAELQRRWESLDFWNALPETAALARANMTGSLQDERRQRLEPGTPFQQSLHSAGAIWSWLRRYWQQVQYRHAGSYEDEKALLLYYRDRELELRRAVQCSSWLGMQQLPGVTNPVPFTSRNISPTQARMNLRQISSGFQAHGRGFLGRAAETEARRRVLAVALAVERFRLRRGSYPNALQELVPELLTSVPTDFMDGKPLRYERTKDGRFALYSVGLDCIENSGRMQWPRPRWPVYDNSRHFDFLRGTDLVWPRPASETEVERWRQGEESRPTQPVIGP